MKKTFLAILLLYVCLTLSSCGEKNAVLPHSSGAYIGSTYSMVKNELEEAGFSNIVGTEIEDLTSKSSLSDGCISAISISGDADFNEKDIYPKDAEILITYHTIPKIQTPIASDALQSFKQEDILELFSTSGFINVTAETVYDKDPNFFVKEYENEVKIGGISSFVEGEAFPFDSEVSVICHLPYKLYDVTIHIVFPSNWFFSTYDVDVLVDGKINTTLKHGENYDLILALKEGTHALSFKNVNDSSVSGSTDFSVNDDIEMEYRINCHSDEIAIYLQYSENKHAAGANEVLMPKSVDDYLHQNYQTIISELQSAGFTNVTTDILYDIELGFTPEGSVDSVSIDGETNFTRGDVFPKNAEVIVTYHMNENDDPTKIKPPYDTETAKGVAYQDVVLAFEETGFTDISTEKRFESAFSGYTAETVANIYINGIGTFDISDAFSPDAEIRIDYYVLSSSDPKSDTELTKFYARKAFEEYGNALYRYGFKCHWFMSLYNEEQYEDGSWFFKVGVTIENAYGNEIEAVAGGTVSGTDKSPEVTQFNIS